MSADDVVLVGVDGSPEAVAAVRWAAARARARGERAAVFGFEEARRVGADLVAVHSWAVPVPVGAGEAAALASVDTTGLEEAGRQVMDDVLAPLRDRYPDVTVRPHLVESDAAGTLLDLAHRAALVVVGSHGHGSLAGLVLGSTSQAVLRRASCPAAVVRLDAGADRQG